MSDLKITFVGASYLFVHRVFKDLMKVPELVPFSTAWMGENHFERNTVALYGVVLLLCGSGYFILQQVIERNSKDSEALKEAFKMSDRKGMISLVLYIASIPLAYIHPYISFAIFIGSSIMWLIPDKNIERALKNDK